MEGGGAERDIFEWRIESDSRRRQRRESIRLYRYNGINVDIHNLRTEYLEQLIDALSEIEVNIHDADNKVRVYCE